MIKWIENKRWNRGKDRRNAIAGIYDKTLRKYKLSPNGDTFIKPGYSMPSVEEVKNYIEKHIKPLMSIIGVVICDKIEDVRGRAQAQLNIVTRSISDMKHDGNDNHPDCFLQEINEEIKKAHAKEAEIESTIFPEKRFSKLSDPLLEKLKKMPSASTGMAGNQADELGRTLGRKVLLSEVELLATRGKDIAKKLSLNISKSVYPPRLSYIILFYVLCSLLAVAEIGFSVPILQNILNVAKYFKWHPANLFFGTLCAIGITISYAILAKTGIDNTLPDKGKKIRLFVIIGLFIFFIQTIFYSIPKGSFGTFWSNLPMGATIAFFSIAFALSNAFLFRKVSFLHHVYAQLNGKTGVPALTKIKEQYIERQKESLLVLNANKISLEAEIGYYDTLRENVKEKIKHLQEISISAFNQGFNRKLEEIIRDNREPQMLLLDKLKKIYGSNEK
jgi:hypothetical protein